MRAGKLRHRIKFQRRATAQDPSGEPVNSWVDVAEVWASIEAKTGHETPTGYAKVMTSFRVRYIEGLLPSMRITAHGKAYDITSIAPDPTLRRELVIMAQELVGVAA